MKKITIIGITLIALLLTIGCAEKAVAPTPTEESAEEEVTEEVVEEAEEAEEAEEELEYKTYTNSEYGFLIGYPESWDVMEDYSGCVVAFFGPSVLEGYYYININVFAEKVIEEAPLENYVRLTELAYKREDIGYKKLQEYDTTISGLPAIVIVFTGDYKFDGETIHMKDRIAIFIKDRIGYQMTFDTPAEFHDEYVDYFDLAMSTFLFTE